MKLLRAMGWHEFPSHIGGGPFTLFLSAMALALMPVVSLAESTEEELSPPPPHSTNAAQLELTDAEQDWIRQNPVLKVAATENWPPFEYRGADGSYQGICADVLRHIGERAGFRIDATIGPWTELYPKLLRGELDLSPGMQVSPDRKEHFFFTRPLLNFPHAIYHHRDAEAPSSLEELAGKKVAVEENYFEHEYLETAHPEIELILAPNSLQALLLVSRGVADAYVGNVAVTSYLLDANVLSDISMGPYAHMGRLELSMGVRKELAPLVSILDKGIAELSPERRRRIVSRHTAMPQLVILEEDEQAWIREHPVIRLGIDPEFAPFEYVDSEGTYRGMASDYIELLNQRLGLNMKVVHRHSWDDAVEEMRVGNLDVLPCIGISQSRAAYMGFSNPYLSFNRVVISRQDTPFYGEIEELADTPIGAQRDSSHHAYLERLEHDPIQLFESFNSTLRAIAQGELDHAVGNAATATYWIKRLGLTNLRLSVPMGSETETLHFGVRKDWPELIAILNKGLASITEEEANAIRKKWMDVEMSSQVDMRRIWRGIGIVLGILLPLLLLLGLHNRILQREVAMRKDTEMLLRESETEYRTLVEGANSIILRIRPNGDITFINSFGERFLGYGENVLINHNIEGTIVPKSDSDAKDMLTILKEIKEHSEAHGVHETSNRTKDGREVRIAWTFRRLLDDAQRLNEILCVGNDVTPQWEAGEMLRRYEFIVNTVNEMMSIINGGGIYEAVNDEWCKAHGRNRDEVIGKYITAVWPEKTVAAAIMPQLEACLAGELVSYEAQIELSTRGLRYCEVTMYPFKGVTNTTTHAIVVAQDITERKEHEVALRNAMAAAEAGTRAKSAFLANMSHEIRTPLNAVLGYAQLLQRSKGLSENQLHALRAIRKSGDHLLTLISDILEFSRIEAGHIEINPEPLDLHQLVEDLELMFQVRTDAKGLYFRVETETDLPRVIVTDRVRLNQVLINLLGNAVKFTEQGGITLKIAHSGATSDSERIHLQFEVIDTGCGIAPHEYEKIFGIFEQAASVPGKGGGTGLGLAISRSFAQLMDGDLQVQSEKGRGSTFIFTASATLGCPDDQPSATSSDRVVGLKPGQAECRVLVVDDRDTNRDLLRRMLETVGFEVREATNGQEALDCQRDWAAHIVLLDLVMPVLDGRAVIRELCATYSKAERPTIIALTASTLMEEKEAILNEGADAFLRKPFQEGELFEAIAQSSQVTFVYEDHPEASKGDLGIELQAAHDAFHALPEEVSERLRSVIMRGAINEAAALCAEIETYSTELAALLKQRTREYRLNELQSLWRENKPT